MLNDDPGEAVVAERDRLIGGEPLDYMWRCPEHGQLVAWDATGGPPSAVFRAARARRLADEDAAAVAARRRRETGT